MSFFQDFNLKSTHAFQDILFPFLSELIHHNCPIKRTLMIMLRNL